MRRIIYVSQATEHQDPAALAAIVDLSRIRNAADNITGMLWTDGASFVQVLEGDAGRITSTMARIMADCRHSAIQVIADVEVTTRMFGDWGMSLPDGTMTSHEIAAFLVGYVGRTLPSASERVTDIVASTLDRDVRPPPHG